MFGGLFSSSEKKFSDDLLQFLIYIRKVEVEEMNVGMETIPLLNLSWRELNTAILERVSLPLSIAFIYFWLLKYYGERGDTVFGHLAQDLRAAGQSEVLGLVPMVMEAHNSAIKYLEENDDESALGNPPWVIARGFCDLLFGVEKGANAPLILYLSRYVAHRFEVVDVGIAEMGQKHLGTPKR